MSISHSQKETGVFGVRYKMTHLCLNVVGGMLSVCLAFHRGRLISPSQLRGGLEKEHSWHT